MNLRTRLVAALRAQTPTPLIASKAIAKRLSLGHVAIKLESERPLGNFKVLGGLPAALVALARASGASVDDLITGRQPPSPLPTLFCASDGNHGLAVAAAGLIARAPATIVLHPGVDRARRDRITALGAQILTVDGTYDDAVAHATKLAAESSGLLVADTSNVPDDPVVSDVMAGYARIAYEIAAQLVSQNYPQPSHLFVQAGVGGLAAVMADRLRTMMQEPHQIVVVEPQSAACVGHALNSGTIERIAGDLATSAEMLACGLASAPAIEILKRHDARSISVTEHELAQSIDLLRDHTGRRSTASGTCGLAGLTAASMPPARRQFALDETSSVLILVTEREVANEWRS